MARLRAASATREITPDPDDGVPMTGYGDPLERVATGVHDDLFARALVLSDGGTTVGVVAADLIGIPRQLGERVRKTLAADGIQLDALLLAATHTHGGPYLPMASRRSLETDVSRTVERIERGLVGSVTEAHGNLAPATLRVGRAENGDTAENRRAAGGVNGGVRVPHGPVDPEVTVLDVETTAGEETVVYNYACHPVCTVGSETLLTADWPGRVARRLREETDATALFLNGAAADINPRDRYAEDRSGEAVSEYMAAIGDEVADSVLSARADARDAARIETAPVTVDRADLELELKAVPDREVLERRADELDAELERLADAGEERGHYDRTNSLRGLRAGDRYWVRTMLSIRDLGLEYLPATMRSIDVGPVSLVGMPGEIFVRHGLDFKAAADGTLLPAGYADAYLGYVPTLEELANGGYEVNSCRLSPAAISEFREAAMALL